MPGFCNSRRSFAIRVEGRRGRASLLWISWQRDDGPFADKLVCLDVSEAEAYIKEDPEELRGNRDDEDTEESRKYRKTQTKATGEWETLSQMLVLWSRESMSYVFHPFRLPLVKLKWLAYATTARFFASGETPYILYGFWLANLLQLMLMTPNF